MMIAPAIVPITGQDAEKCGRPKDKTCFPPSGVYVVTTFLPPPSSTTGLPASFPALTGLSQERCWMDMAGTSAYFRSPC
jgi:hypothetical protein